MKAIIIEDEELAAQRLRVLINECDPEIEVIAMLESISDSVEWFRQNSQPDLIFLDIHLEDGLSFTIFEEIKINVPIIFTTAFDEYAIKAFKLKSIDYLLKPILKEELCCSIEKYKEWHADKRQLVDLNDLMQLIAPEKQSYRKRFSVAVADKLRTIDVKDIAYFFSSSDITFAVTFDKHQYSINQSINKLFCELNPSEFFRINRQYLVCHKAIVNVHVYSKSRLKLELNPPVTEMVFVSLDKVPRFRKWLDGK
ncbi:MAG: LytTR family DNA-binding domain-containing protein [Bacteroidales bacterium]|nr:LytTR family DNA-binding domain-containing protein [Bacteroidales bacterium]